MNPRKLFRSTGPALPHVRIKSSTVRENGATPWPVLTSWQADCLIEQYIALLPIRNRAEGAPS